MTHTAHDSMDIAALLPELRTLAARLSRVPDEGEDLLHDALLEAVRVGRADLSQAVNYRWLVGTMRNLSAMTARSAVRRRVRETRWADEDVPRYAALRQRIAALRKRLGRIELPAEYAPSSSDALPLGLIRRALLPVVVATETIGAHDPDGQLLAIASTGAHVLPISGHKRVHAVTSLRSSQESAP